MAFAQWRFICATPTLPILSVWPGMSSTTFHDPASQSCEGPCSKCPGGWSLRALKLPRHSSWHFPNLRWFERLGQGCFGPWYTARFVLKVWFQPAIMTPAETWIDQITSNIHQITTYPELVILQVHRLMLAACCLLPNCATLRNEVIPSFWEFDHSEEVGHEGNDQGQACWSCLCARDGFLMPFAQNWEANLGSTWTGTEEGFQKSRQCSFRRGKSHTDTNPSAYHASLGSWLSLLHSKPGSFLKYFCQSQKPLYFIKTFRIHSASCALAPKQRTQLPS